LHRPGNEEDEAEEGKVISVTVNYATSLTFDDDQHANENNFAAMGNDDAGGENGGMNDDDGSNSRGIHDNEGEQQVKEEMGGAWKRVTKKRKSQIRDDELRTYFDFQLRGVGRCPNLRCSCLAIIVDVDDVRDSVVKYLCWFNAKT
jgi:hypothetical protein